MPKTLGYYCTSEPQIDQLEQQFGSQLEGLTRLDKIQIQLTLAVLVACIEYNPSATMQTAVDETPIDAFSDDALKAVELLRGISQDGAQSLILALSHHL